MEMLQRVEYEFLMEKLNSLIPTAPTADTDDFHTVNNAINYIKYLNLLLSKSPWLFMKTISILPPAFLQENVKLLILFNVQKIRYIRSTWFIYKI